MANVYLVNTKSKRKYRVVRVDKEKNEVTLKGEYAEFTETFDKTRFKSLGYELVKEEEHEDA
jgi:hypothetical protein